MPVRAPAVDTDAAFVKAAEEAAARVEVTSDLSNPITNAKGLLDMYREGQLKAYASAEVERELEEAAEIADQNDRLSKSSLGRSKASHE